MRIEGPKTTLLDAQSLDPTPPSPGGIPLGALPGDGVERYEAEAPGAKARLDCPTGTHAEVTRLSPQSVEVTCVEDQKKTPAKKPTTPPPPARGGGKDPDAPIIE
jgi:hypothetical protein